MLQIVGDSKYFSFKDSYNKSVDVPLKAYYKANKDQDFQTRFDEFTVVDGIEYVDQMLLYANVRRSSGALESYSLDFIAHEELGSEKLDYTGYTIKNLAWLNFPKFVHYNMIDVVLLKRIEDKVLDCEMLQALSEVTNTRKHKVFKKTVALKNYITKFAEKQGFVITDNKNAKYGDDYEYFEKQYLQTVPVIESEEKYIVQFDKKDNYGAYVEYSASSISNYC